MSRFPIFSATAPVAITPDCFAQMSSDMQTQAVLFLAESGVNRDDILKATGLTDERLGHVENKTHRVMPTQPERPLDAPAFEAQKNGAIPLNAGLALLWFANGGAKRRISQQSLEAAAGLGQCSAYNALGWLIDHGYLTVFGEKRRGIASAYELTSAGQALAASLSPPVGNHSLIGRQG